MAAEDAIAIIKRSISDETFKLALSRDFDKAIADNQLVLTQDETDALRKIDWTQELPSVPGLGGKWVHVYSSVQ